MHSFLHYVIKRVTTSSPRTLLSALRHETNFVMKRGELVTATSIKAWQKVWENSSERRGGRGAAGVGNQSASCPQLNYLGMLRRIGELERRTSFMSSLVYSSFCSSLDDLFWKCICQSSYTGTEIIPNNGQFLTTTTTSYTSLYFILDKYHYSKAPSPGINDCFVSCMFFWNRFKNHPDIDTTSREKSVISTLKELY